jgi:hypothetical protein
MADYYNICQEAIERDWNGFSPFYVNRSFENKESFVKYVEKADDPWLADGACIVVTSRKIGDGKRVHRSAIKGHNTIYRSFFDSNNPAARAARENIIRLHNEAIEENRRLGL